MHPYKRIPLEERMQTAGREETFFLAAFEAHPEDYLETLNAISGTSYFKKSFDTAFEDCHELSNSLLDEMVYLAADLPSEKRCDLFYRLLVEPFAIISAFEMRGGYE